MIPQNKQENKNSSVSSKFQLVIAHYLVKEFCLVRASKIPMKVVTPHQSSPSTGNLAVGLRGVLVKNCGNASCDEFHFSNVRLKQAILRPV